MHRLLKMIGMAAVSAMLALPGAASADEAPLKLRVAVAAPTVIYGPFWVGLANGMFKKNGLDIDLVSTNALSTGAAMVVSDQADVLLTGVFLGLRIASQGKKLAYIMDISDMTARFNGMVSKLDIKSMSDLKARGDNCRILVLPAGSASWAILKGIMDVYGLKCSISTAGTMPNVVAGALSGQFDAAMVNAQDAYAARDAGKANILIDPATMTQQEAQSYYPFKHPYIVALGLKDSLAGKRAAVDIFIKTMREAAAIIAKTSPEELGEMMAKQLPNVFQSTPASSLTLGWKLQEGVFPSGPNAGFIGADEWNTLLASSFKLWNFATLDPKDPNVAYDNVVDMSYFNETK
jgi:ABC-type nitrate/sulfonate/bicarbonate transport system substrate-binding protein